MSSRIVRTQPLEFFKDRFTYDPETGNFTSKGFGYGSVSKNKITGTKLIVDRVNHSAGRVAWGMVYGAYPERDLTYIDGDKCNTAIANLMLSVKKNYGKVASITDLKSVLNYDRDSGVFTWKTRVGKAKPGDTAGTVIKDNHLQVTVWGKPYKCSRLAWAFEYNQWPKRKLYHLNGRNGDDRIDNLAMQEPLVSPGNITIERLKDLLHYDPDTGEFTWVKRTSNRINLGDVAGQIDDHGHREIRIDSCKYRAHRLAWLWEYGRLPKSDLQIDHINGVRDDNRIINLREVTGSINQQNRRSASKNNTTGALGVHKAKNGYRVRLNVDGKEKICGYFSFDQFEEAKAFALEMKRKYHEGCTI